MLKVNVQLRRAELLEGEILGIEVGKEPADLFLAEIAGFGSQFLDPALFINECLNPILVGARWRLANPGQPSKPSEETPCDRAEAPFGMWSFPYCPPYIPAASTRPGPNQKREVFVTQRRNSR